jgi:hypothetical protein
MPCQKLNTATAANSPVAVSNAAWWLFIALYSSY